MPEAGRARRLATILFLDIVGSTQIAAELGDRRWRELLDRFRSIVRTELKRHRGHEEDTAGDGFFITFAQPAEAVRAAAAIATGVHDIGLEVRCGLHFGEAEMIDGRRGGIAVHLGSRVMSLAGAAEVLMTTTVRDLITGTETVLEDAGTHELKGSPAHGRSGGCARSKALRFRGRWMPIRRRRDGERCRECSVGIGAAGC